MGGMNFRERLQNKPNVYIQVFAICFFVVNEILSNCFKNLKPNKPKAEVNALTLQNDDDQ